MSKENYLAFIASLLFLQDQLCFASGMRDYYNYELKYKNQVVYIGQTNNLSRRATEHLRDGKTFTSMKKVGKAKTKEGSLKAEEKSLRDYRKTHQGNNPKYNQTNHG